MSVMSSPHRPTRGVVERNGPRPRRGNVYGAPPVHDVGGPLTGSGAIAIATDVGDTVLLDPASDIDTVGTVTTVTTVTTVATVGSITGIATPVTVETSPANPLDVEPHDVDVRVDVLGTPTQPTGAAAGSKVPIHTLEVDSAGDTDPLRRIFLQTAAGADLSTSASGGVRSLDSSVHDGAGNRIGSQTSAGGRGLRVFMVNQSANADVPRFIAVDPGGSSSQASVLAVPGSTIPAGTKGLVIYDPHFGRLRGDTTAVYAEVLESRDEAASSAYQPLLVSAVKQRFKSLIAEKTATASGNNVIVTGVGGIVPCVRKISAALSSSGSAVDVGFRFKTTGTTYFNRELRPNMQIEIDFREDYVWKGADADDFSINLSAANSVEVTVMYDARETN